MVYDLLLRIPLNIYADNSIGLLIFIIKFKTD